MSALVVSKIYNSVYSKIHRESVALRCDKALTDLKRVCREQGIMLIYNEMPAEYFIFYEDKKEIILSPSANANHINMLTAFILA